MVSERLRNLEHAFLTTSLGKFFKHAPDLDHQLALDATRIEVSAFLNHTLHIVIHGITVGRIKGLEIGTGDIIEILR